jgi:hypothetical protein
MIGIPFGQPKLVARVWPGGHVPSEPQRVESPDPFLAELGSLSIAAGLGLTCHRVHGYRRRAVAKDDGGRQRAGTNYGISWCSALTTKLRRSIRLK